MATLQTDEANIVDADAINWRLIVFPALVVLIIGFGALGYYYYLQNQRETAETQARLALVKATTPEEFLKVAEQYPHTDQATLALLSAADAAFAKQNYDGALDAYRQVIENPSLSQIWHDTAILGSASAYEAKNDTDKAITAYLNVAHRGDQSPFAPYAYNAAARIYDQRGDKSNETTILGQAAGLDPASPFTRMAQEKLKELVPSAPMSFNVPANANIPAPAAPSAPAAPASANPAPTTPAK